jgi:hypothetical protein
VHPACSPQKKKVQKRKYLSLSVTCLFFLRVSGVVGNKRKPDEKRDSITIRQKKRARACIITRKRRSFHEDRGDSSRSSGG